ncbi:hypothetical protein Ana3638_18375 [Anaerocolumna sedimenticola]|uniref:Chlor_Arch_YYY domain-containing protein n=1 Tax=Anaerocolumna sedimenticola TaxID=2696063 RepID=A0A6P1TRY0_9FIRM|nr:DUF2298 domain-containing protein [Anaerocolumna sedimenticola]QHQ62506.1 hypothetical protein Ana3638_18375 [Anaerocolumna sedimenticola]
MVTPDKITAMITEELLFLFLFLIWTYIRGFKPEAYGTEKFMDYGFMTIMMRGDYMPPKDLWFAGSTINYYYVGQYMAAFMTKLSLCTVNVGYNLMLMTLAAFAFVLPLSLIYNVTQNFLEDYTIKYKRTPVFAGLLSGAGVCFAGNMHFTLFYWIVPILRNLLGIKSDDDSHYWFPDSTRYIGYNPDTKDKTIHEFPSYSFILGDLHAHVINIIFVLTVLGILFAWMLYRKKQRNMIGQEEKSHKKRLWKEILNPYILLIGFFIGLFHTTNFWDFPIYYVVAGAVILFSNLVDYGMDIALNEDGRYRLSQKPFWITAFQGITVIIVAKLTALPFTLNFDQISTKIQISYAHTPFYQLIILWGLPITLVLGLFIELIQKFNQKSKEPQTLESGELKINESNHSNLIIKFLAGLNISELFILTLGLCGIGLVLIPELVYVKDIYSGDYKRANTMFKLTYQAFILFGTSAGFIFLKFIRERRFRWQIKFVIFTLILFLSSLWYSKVSIGAWYGNIFNTAGYKGLDAAAYLKTQMPYDFKAINWMNENIKGTPVILEANGDSYSDYERVSVATGLPTVLGWYVHEWLWRGNTEVIDKRAADIQNIYTSSDKELVKSLIDKYQIEYIYVGKCEMEKYETVNDTLLKSLGDVVFSIPAANDKTYATYVIHIEPKG